LAEFQALCPFRRIYLLASGFARRTLIVTAPDIQILIIPSVALSTQLNRDRQG
jgi:hypothetical protein